MEILGCECGSQRQEPFLQTLNTVLWLFTAYNVCWLLLQEKEGSWCTVYEEKIYFVQKIIPIFFEKDAGSLLNMLRKVGQIPFYVSVILIYFREWSWDCWQRFPELCGFLAPNWHSGHCCDLEVCHLPRDALPLLRLGSATPRGRGSQLHPGASASLPPSIDRGVKTL